MMTLVIGGSKCGKSHFAESLFSQFPHRKIYLATMMPFASEAQIAIDRHRQSRLGKGFETMERFTDLHTLSLPSPCGVLLECLGNLCANELFCDAPTPDPVEKIMAGICHLRSTAMQLVIVSNDVGSDGIAYAKETERYIQVLGELNCRLAKLADQVVECVCGIPIYQKEVLR